MSRAGALARLAAAYGSHQARRRFRREGPGLERLLATYAPDRFLPLTAGERELLPAASACIGCGLCSVVAARTGALRTADLAQAYLRDYPLLGRAASDVVSPPSEIGAELAAAAAACPVGVPLEGVLGMVRRLASS